MSNMYPTQKSLDLLKHYGSLESSDKFHYVTIHSPESDSATLEETMRIGIVDLYWAYEDNAFLVSILRDPDRQASSRYSPRTGELRGDFFISIQAGPLNVQRIEVILSTLVEWIRNNNKLTREVSDIIKM